MQVAEEDAAAGQRQAGLSDAEIEKATGAVVSSTIACKTVRTVSSKDGGIEDAAIDASRGALAHLVGLSRAEVGQQMDKTEEAVRSLLHRAKARLAMLLDGPA